MFRWNSVTERTSLRSVIWGTSIVLKAYNYTLLWMLRFARPAVVIRRENDAPWRTILELRCQVGLRPGFHDSSTHPTLLLLSARFKYRHVELFFGEPQCARALAAWLHVLVLVNCR